MQKVAYLAHPVGGDVINNLEKAKSWFKFLTQLAHPPDGVPNWDSTLIGITYSADWITECQLWDDADPKQRSAGMNRNFQRLLRCDGIVMVGPKVSAGMQREADVAYGKGLYVLDLTGRSQASILAAVESKGNAMMAVRDLVE